MIEKCWRCCLTPEDFKQEIYLLHQRLLNVGHNPTKLNFAFAKASWKLHKKINQKGLIKQTFIKKEILKPRQRLFLHPAHHPKDTSRKMMQ